MYDQVASYETMMLSIVTINSLKPNDAYMRR